MFCLPSFSPVLVYPTPATPWTFANASPWGWWDFNDSGNTIISNAFATVLDKSGNNRSVTQPTAASRPTVATFNGVTVGNFTSAQFLQNVSVSSTWTGYQIFAAFNYTGNLVSAAGNRIIAFGAATTNDATINGFSVLRVSSANSVGSLNSGSTIRSETPYTLGSWALISAFHDGSQSGINVNGGADTLEANAFGTKNPVRLGIGRSIGFANGNWIGQIAEIAIFQTPQSADIIQRAQGYMLHKIGQQSSLPANHPYRNSPPAA